MLLSLEILKRMEKEEQLKLLNYILSDEKIKVLRKVKKVDYNNFLFFFRNFNSLELEFFLDLDFELGKLYKILRSSNKIHKAIWLGKGEKKLSKILVKGINPLLKRAKFDEEALKDFIENLNKFELLSRLEFFKEIDKISRLIVNFRLIYKIFFHNRLKNLLDFFIELENIINNLKNRALEESEKFNIVLGISLNIEKKYRFDRFFLTVKVLLWFFRELKGSYYNFLMSQELEGFIHQIINSDLIELVDKRTRLWSIIENFIKMSKFIMKLKMVEKSLNFNLSLEVEKLYKIFREFKKLIILIQEYLFFFFEHRENMAFNICKNSHIHFSLINTKLVFKFKYKGYIFKIYKIAPYFYTIRNKFSIFFSEKCIRISPANSITIFKFKYRGRMFYKCKPANSTYFSNIKLITQKYFINYKDLKYSIII